MLRRFIANHVFVAGFSMEIIILTDLIKIGAKQKNAYTVGIVTISMERILRKPNMLVKPTANKSPTAKKTLSPTIENVLRSRL